MAYITEFDHEGVRLLTNLHTQVLMFCNLPPAIKTLPQVQGNLQPPACVVFDNFGNRFFRIFTAPRFPHIQWVNYRSIWLSCCISPIERNWSSTESVNILHIGNGQNAYHPFLKYDVTNNTTYFCEPSMQKISLKAAAAYQDIYQSDLAKFTRSSKSISCHTRRAITGSYVTDIVNCYVFISNN